MAINAIYELYLFGYHNIIIMGTVKVRLWMPAKFNNAKYRLTHDDFLSAILYDVTSDVIKWQIWYVASPRFTCFRRLWWMVLWGLWPVGWYIVTRGTLDGVRQSPPSCEHRQIKHLVSKCALAEVINLPVLFNRYFNPNIVETHCYVMIPMDRGAPAPVCEWGDVCNSCTELCCLGRFGHRDLCHHFSADKDLRGRNVLN